jgi:hypothetical protein
MIEVRLANSRQFIFQRYVQMASGIVLALF